MKEEQEVQGGINELCQKCQHYKNGCTGLITADFVEVISCGKNKKKYKRKKSKNKK